MTMWAELEVGREDSTNWTTIFDWRVELVKEILRNFTSGGYTARPQTYYPITLRDIKASILIDLVIPVLNLISRKSTG
eukprot:50019-Amphidinium_carterae.1